MSRLAEHVRQRPLFTTDQRPEGEVLSDLSDAAAILAMGPDGIGIETRDRLRRELLAAADELRVQWLP